MSTDASTDASTGQTGQTGQTGPEDGARCTCSRCGASKPAEAFRSAGIAAEDLSQCRGCRGELRRAQSRARIEREAEQTMAALLNPRRVARRRARVA